MGVLEQMPLDMNGTKDLHSMRYRLKKRIAAYRQWHNDCNSRHDEVAVVGQKNGIHAQQFQSLYSQFQAQEKNKVCKIVGKKPARLKPKNEISYHKTIASNSGLRVERSNMNHLRQNPMSHETNLNETRHIAKEYGIKNEITCKENNIIHNENQVLSLHQGNGSSTITDVVYKEKKSLVELIDELPDVGVAINNFAHVDPDRVLAAALGLDLAFPQHEGSLHHAPDNVHSVQKNRILHDQGMGQVAMIRGMSHQPYIGSYQADYVPSFYQFQMPTTGTVDHTLYLNSGYSHYM